MLRDLESKNDPHTSVLHTSVFVTGMRPSNVFVSLRNVSQGTLEAAGGVVLVLVGRLR